MVCILRYVVLDSLRAIRDIFPFVLICELFWHSLLSQGAGGGDTGLYYAAGVSVLLLIGVVGILTCDLHSDHLVAGAVVTI